MVSSGRTIRNFAGPAPPRSCSAVHVRRFCHSTGGEDTSCARARAATSRHKARTMWLAHQMLRVVNARTCAPNRAWHGRSGRDR